MAEKNGRTSIPIPKTTKNVFEKYKPMQEDLFLKNGCLRKLDENDFSRCKKAQKFETSHNYIQYDADTSWTSTPSATTVSSRDLKVCESKDKLLLTFDNGEKKRRVQMSSILQKFGFTDVFSSNSDYGNKPTSFEAANIILRKSPSFPVRTERYVFVDYSMDNVKLAHAKLMHVLNAKTPHFDGICKSYPQKLQTDRGLEAKKKQHYFGSSQQVLNKSQRYCEQLTPTKVQSKNYGQYQGNNVNVENSVSVDENNSIRTHFRDNGFDVKDYKPISKVPRAKLSRRNELNEDNQLKPRVPLLSGGIRTDEHAIKPMEVKKSFSEIRHSKRNSLICANSIKFEECDRLKKNYSGENMCVRPNMRDSGNAAQTSCNEMAKASFFVNSASMVKSRETVLNDRLEMDCLQAFNMKDRLISEFEGSLQSRENHFKSSYIPEEPIKIAQEKKVKLEDFCRTNLAAEKVPNVLSASIEPRDVNNTLGPVMPSPIGLPCPLSQYSIHEENYDTISRMCTELLELRYGHQDILETYINTIRDKMITGGTVDLTEKLAELEAEYQDISNMVAEDAAEVAVAMEDNMKVEECAFKERMLQAQEWYEKTLDDFEKFNVTATIEVSS